MKTDMEGNAITYKSRLVAKGSRQRQGIDYEDTFSMLAMLTSKKGYSLSLLLIIIMR